MGDKFKELGLHPFKGLDDKLRETENNLPPDDVLTVQKTEFEYIKPGRNPDVLNEDLMTELVAVRETGNEHVGRGLFARAKIEAGQEIFEFDGARRAEKKGLPPSRDGYSAHAIVVGNMRGEEHYFVYAIPNKLSPLRYLNHSCNPNAARKPGDMFGFVALREIEPGEEITADYSLLEANPYWKMEQCGCGSTNCRHTVESVSSLPLENLLEHWQRLTPEMQQFAIRFSQDPKIVEIRNKMGAENISTLPEAWRPIKSTYSYDDILLSEHPTIVSWRNLYGAKLLAPVFLEIFKETAKEELAA